MSLKSHYDILYSRADSLDDALLALLPASLANERVRALCSTSFLTLAGLERLEESCARLAPCMSPPGESCRVLDVGCGRGQLGFHLAQTVCGTLVGVDFAESAVRAAQLELGRAATFVQADIVALPFMAASFNLVLAIDSLYLCDVPKTALAEIRRVLTAGGYLVGSTYRLVGPSSADRPPSWWEARLYEVGFEMQQWNDVTAEWRHVMTAKHQLRWSDRNRLISSHGQKALAECLVSCRMLGLDGRPGFIDLNSRWEFVASTCDMSGTSRTNPSSST
ncbi:methyltransferase type 11 [Burkholderia pseudomallei]|uniref:class I SAM-dependent methyltransferase n=1 Tax=Burkholderia pseudomallei TaxID=28450 RepID=UPI000F090712|nr:methyltransferase type 11 [Burkholderia pseudomallei]